MLAREELKSPDSVHAWTPTVTFRRELLLFCSARHSVLFNPRRRNGGLCLAEWRENCCWPSVEAAATGTPSTPDDRFEDHGLFKRKQERREPRLPRAPAALSLNQVSPVAKSHVPLPRTSPDPSDVGRGQPLAKQGRHTQGTPDTGPRGQFSTSSSA